MLTQSQFALLQNINIRDHFTLVNIVPIHKDSSGSCYSRLVPVTDSAKGSNVGLKLTERGIYDQPSDQRGSQKGFTTSVGYSAIIIIILSRIGYTLHYFGPIILL